MRFFTLVIFLVCVGCAPKTENKPTIGKVLRKQLVCVSEESCREGLDKACPTGGVIHGAGPVMLIEFSCNSR